MGGTERKEGTKKEIRNTGREVLQKTRRENVKRDEKWSTAPQASPEERLQAGCSSGTGTQSSLPPLRKETGNRPGASV